MCCACVSTDVSVHDGGKADGFFVAAADGFLQRVDHLFIGVDLIIEQHAVVGVPPLPAHVHTHTESRSYSIEKVTITLPNSPSFIPETPSQPTAAFPATSTTELQSQPPAAQSWVRSCRFPQFSSKFTHSAPLSISLNNMHALLRVSSADTACQQYVLAVHVTAC